MIVQIFGIEHKLELEDHQVGILNINPANLNYKICTVFKRNDDEQNEIVIFNGSERVKCNSICYVSDIMEFCVDNKILHTKIVKDIKRILNDDVILNDQLIEKYHALSKYISDYINQYELDYEIDDDLQLQNLLKICNLNFNLETDNCYEAVIQIIACYKKILGYNIFIFRNLATVMEENALNSLLNIAKQYEVTIILIENKDFVSVVTNKILTITEDYSSYLLY